MFTYLPAEAHLDDAADIYRSNRAYLSRIDPLPNNPADAVRRDCQRLPPAGAEKLFCLISEHGQAVAILDYLHGYPDADCAYIGLLLVHGRLHGQGTGERIVADFCRRMRRAGFQRVRLSVLYDNPDACRFWLRQNFVPVARKTVVFRTRSGSVMKAVNVLQKNLR